MFLESQLPHKIVNFLLTITIVDGSRPAPMPHTRPHPAPAPKMAVVGKKLTPTPVPKKGPSAHPYLQNRQINLSISDNKQ